MSDPGERVRAKVQAAIDQALADEHEMATGFVCLIEAMGTDGQRGVWTLHHDGALPWDTLGLLAYGTQVEQARTVRDEADL